MKKFKRIGLSLLLICVMLMNCMATVIAAVDDGDLNHVIRDTAQYILRTVPKPQVGYTGGEWAVLGLARSEHPVPAGYFDEYYYGVEDYVKSCDGNLSNNKYTEYSRLIVALSSIGRDPSNVAGYDLLVPLEDYCKTISQGLNGPIWALIALDTRNYPMPENPDAQTQATRDIYIQCILDCQLPDGGWSLLGGTDNASPGDNTSDPDITGMALQALAKYQDRPEVETATQQALACMSRMQNAKGGFTSWGTENSESCVQMIVALCELGIPLDDSRFVKHGNTMLDNLMTFYQEGNGFSHTADGRPDQMATEQAFYGMVAAQRLRDGRSSLYRMDDAEPPEQPAVWYYTEVPDGREGIYKVYLTDIGSVSDEDTDSVTALVARYNEELGIDESQGLVYSFMGDTWIDTGDYAGLPGSGGVGIADTDLDSDLIKTDSFFIKRLSLEELKYNVMEKVFDTLGISEDNFEPDDIDYFLQGVAVGIDDNVTFGLFQTLLRLPTAYDEYFFDAGKVITDAAFLTFYSNIAGVSGGAAVYLFAQAEVTATVSVVALAGGVTAPAGVVVEVGSLSTLAASAGCTVASNFAAKAAARSNNFLMASKNARDGLPTFNAGTFRSNLKKLVGDPPSGMVEPRAHHVLPQQFVDWFKSKKIVIHDPKYGTWLSKQDHNLLHYTYKYNDLWRQWKNLHDDASVSEILDYARSLAARFGFTMHF